MDLAAFRPFASAFRKAVRRSVNPIDRDELERTWNRANLPYGW